MLLLEDVSSLRANKQIKCLNRAESGLRYIDRILLIEISGKKITEEIKEKITVILEEV